MEWLQPKVSLNRCVFNSLLNSCRMSIFISIWHGTMWMVTNNSSTILLIINMTCGIAMLVLTFCDSLPLLTTSHLKCFLTQYFKQRLVWGFSPESSIKFKFCYINNHQQITWKSCPGTELSRVTTITYCPKSNHWPRLLDSHDQSMTLHCMLMNIIPQLIIILQLPCWVSRNGLDSRHQ